MGDGCQMSKKTENRGSQLARRLRVNIDRKTKEAKKRAEEKARLLEAALKERVALMNDLAAFGEAVGFEMRRSGTHVVYQMGDLQIEFDGSNEDGTVKLNDVEDRPEHYGLQFEHRLNKWVLTIDRDKGHDEQLVLFDTGLEYLAYKVFGLEAADEAEMLEAEREKQEKATEPPKRSL